MRVLETKDLAVKIDLSEAVGTQDLQEATETQDLTEAEIDQDPTEVVAEVLDPEAEMAVEKIQEEEAVDLRRRDSIQLLWSIHQLRSKKRGQKSLHEALPKWKSTQNFNQELNEKAMSIQLRYKTRLLKL
jgi:hypothetical protein